MKLNPKKSKIVGLLFLFATTGYGLGNGLVVYVLYNLNYMSDISVSNIQLIVGTLLMLINSVSIVGIGVMLFPFSEEQNKRIVIGYLSSRILKSLLLIVGLISLLSLIAITEEYIKTGTSNSAHSETISLLAKKANLWAYEIALIVLGLFSLGSCYLLYKSKLAPASISILGFVGYALLIAGALFELFGFTIGMLLFIPGGLFEIILGIFFVVKGSNFSKVNACNINFI